ncbi:MAG: TAXI family TRAP transporter solute-binding subunit [Candidatus Rokubacteria bacterium]|nr:TAXI family TRAP transporter solute-binding subunit [Candidatus Rokubacteria bacterium]
MINARILLVISFMVVLAAGPVSAQPPASIGSNPPGSALYAVASGVAKVATDAGVVRLNVQPYAGSSTFLPLLDTGELEFGLNNSVDLGLSYRGPTFKIGGRNPMPAVASARLVFRSAPLVVAPVVRRDAPYRTIQDLKGKRVTGEYPANLAIWYNVFGWLSSAGLTWDDVKVVRVVGLNEGIDALIQGRADASSYALNGAKVREADATVGVRHLSLDCSPEGEKRLRAAVPGYYPKRIAKGAAAGVLEDICAAAYDTYVVAGKGADDKLVEALAHAVWENADKLPAFHPLLRGWTRQDMAHADVTLPYHPAAIRFYKEKGVWTPAMEQAQQRLLAVSR